MDLMAAACNVIVCPRNSNWGYTTRLVAETEYEVCMAWASATTLFICSGGAVVLVDSDRWTDGWTRDDDDTIEIDVPQTHIAKANQV